MRRLDLHPRRKLRNPGLPAPAPEGLRFHGGTVIREHDPAWRPELIERISWMWAFDPA